MRFREYERLVENYEEKGIKNYFEEMALVLRTGGLRCVRGTC